MQTLSTWYRHYFPVAAIVEDKQNYLLKIPLELVLTILKNLNAADLVHLGRTCKTFHHLTQDRTVNLGKLNLFKKMREERLCDSPYSWSFFVEGHQVVYTNTVGNAAFFEIRHLKHNQTRTIVEKGGIENGELDDFFFFIYKDDAALKIKFVSRANSFLETELTLGSTETTITKVKCHANCVVIQIGDYLICIKNAQQFFVIPPLEFEDGTDEHIIDFDVNEKHLILCREVHTLSNLLSLFKRSNYFLHQLYDLNTEKLISHRMTHDRISRNFITDRFIISVAALKFPYGYADIRITDLKFNEKSRICLLHYAASLNWEYVHNISCHKYYCYEDRLIAFLNMHSLLFYNLNTGNLIKVHELQHTDTDLALDYTKIVRLSPYCDTVAASTNRTIKLFDIRTGNIIQTFWINALPVWINLKRDYTLTYTAYDVMNQKKYFAQLKTP